MDDRRLLHILTTIEGGKPTAEDVAPDEIRYLFDNELAHGGVWVKSAPISEAGSLPDPTTGQEYPTILTPKGIEKLRELRVGD